MLARASIWKFLIPTVVVGGGLCIWIAWPGEKDIALRNYRSAGCVTPFSDQHARSWNATLPLPGGISVRIAAHGWVSGYFELAFSDETGIRSVTRTRDYVYPHDARYEPATNTLWLVVSGMGGGAFPEARVYKYDLRARVVLGEWDVSPDDVSNECPAQTFGDPAP